MITYDDLIEIVQEALEEIAEGGKAITDDFESFGIDYETIAEKLIGMMGKKGAAYWLSGYHAGLHTASKHWEYRVPPSE